MPKRYHSFCSRKTEKILLYAFYIVLFYCYILVYTTYLRMPTYLSFSFFLTAIMWPLSVEEICYGQDHQTVLLFSFDNLHHVFNP